MSWEESKDQDRWALQTIKNCAGKLQPSSRREAINFLEQSAAPPQRHSLSFSAADVEANANMLAPAIRARLVRKLQHEQQQAGEPVTCAVYEHEDVSMTVEEIQRLNISPGDTLILQTKKHMSAAERKAFEETLHNSLGRLVKVVVISGEVFKMTVVNID